MESNAKIGPEPKADPTKFKAQQGEPNQKPDRQGSQSTEDKSVAIEQANPRIELDTLDVTFSILALLMWISLVAAGVAISSKHYIENLAAPTKHTLGVVVGSGLVVVTCHIVPNGALLSCLAAYLGVLASRTFPSQTGKPHLRDDHKAAFTMGVTRGFYVYLLILSGSVLFSSQGFGQWATRESSSAAASDDYETYTRLVGLASLISFTAGYNPELFKFLLRTLRSSRQSNKIQHARPEEVPPAKSMRQPVENNHIHANLCRDAVTHRHSKQNGHLVYCHCRNPITP